MDSCLEGGEIKQTLSKTCLSGSGEGGVRKGMNSKSAIHQATGLCAAGWNSLQRLFSHSRLEGFFPFPQESCQLKPGMVLSLTW